MRVRSRVDALCLEDTKGAFDGILAVSVAGQRTVGGEPAGSVPGDVEFGHHAHASHRQDSERVTLPLPSWCIAHIHTW